MGRRPSTSNCMRSKAWLSRAFASTLPTVPAVWHCVADRERVELSRKDYFARESHAFDRMQFEVDGRLPMPAA